MLVNVVIVNTVTLHPLNLKRVNNLELNVIYTYHRTSIQAGVMWIFIDQTQTWYPKEWFREHGINPN